MNDKDICQIKVRALRSAYNTDQEIRCRTCENYHQDCYIPFDPRGEPVRQGKLAYILQKEGLI